MIKVGIDEFSSDPCVWTWQCVKIGPNTFRKNFPGEAPSKNVYKIRDWCDKHDSSGKYFPDVSRFYFENSEDATLFALRWL